MKRVVWLLMALPLAAADSGEQTSQLVEVKRIFVDRLGGGEVAGHVRDMIINGLQRCGLFVITENPDKADATLKGSAEDLVFTDTFQSSDGVGMRASAGTGTDRSTDARSRRASVSVTDRESRKISERKHEAAAAVRLVNKDGDVIWSTTQESLGAKFRGASADVAEKIMRQLLEDYQKAKRTRAGVIGPGGR
ncbi:MAG: hypothetical protein U0Q16_12340 [Bryobacteraceae bacterium]